MLKIIEIVQSGSTIVKFITYQAKYSKFEGLIPPYSQSEYIHSKDCAKFSQSKSLKTEYVFNFEVLSNLDRRAGNSITN